MGMLDDALAFLDAKKRLIARNIGDLAANPSDVLNQWGSQVKEDTKSLGQVARGVSSSDPQAQQAAVAGLLPLGLLGMTAYHGSPHSFDQFDMSKIGSGEGAQAFGHGLYFAENPQVAQGYQRTLANDTYRVKGSGETFDPSSLEHLNVRTAAYSGDLDAAIAKASQIAKTDSPVAPLAARDMQRLSDLQTAGGIEKNNGSLYTVDIPDTHIAKMLDWDKPMSQQPANVQKALGESGDRTGAQVYQDLALKMADRGGRAKLSRMMNEFGIPGIRYLDRGSRGAGGGTSNFVVFDDSLPQMIGRE